MLEFPPDYTLLVQLGSFFLLLFLLNKLLFAPFMGLLVEREVQTEGATASAEAARARADEIRANVEAQLASARAQATAEAETVRRQARADEAAIFEKAKAEAAHTLAEMRKAIATEREKAQAILRTEAAVLADQMVAAVLGRTRAN